MKRHAVLLKLPALDFEALDKAVRMIYNLFDEKIKNAGGITMKKLAVISGFIFAISMFNICAVFAGENDVNRELRKGNFRHISYTADGEKKVQKNAGTRERTPLMLSISKRQHNLAKILIEKGADINAKDSSGQTALFYAINAGDARIAKLLIERGSEINASDANGRTPLLLAILKNRPGIAKLLIEKGADVNARF